MRKTKVITKNCIEVLYNDGKPQRVYPSHDWWHIFVRMAQLEDLTEPMLVSTEYDDEFTCPNCKAYNDDCYNVRTLKFCPECGQRLKWE